MGGGHQFVQDAALGDGVLRIAACTQLAELSLQGSHRLEPRARQLRVDQAVYVTAVILRAVHEIQQPRHIERPAVANEREPRHMRWPVGPVAVRPPGGRRQYPRPLVIP